MPWRATWAACRMDISLIAVKIVVAAGLVLGLSLIAERFSPRTAGFLSGAPLGALITYYFVGLEAGVDFVAAGIPHAIAGLCGTLLFVYVYFRMAAKNGRWVPAWATLSGLGGYFFVAMIIKAFAFTIPIALALTLPVVGLTALAMGRAENLQIQNPVRLTLRLLLIRAGAAAVLVTAIVSIAQILGPVWGGLLGAFPMTLLPTMLIVHITYSGGHVRALLRALPFGLGGLIAYLIVIAWAFPNLGVHWGTLAGLAAAFLYLGLVSAGIRRRERG